MDKQELLQYLAPCSLVCYTCPGLKDGAISKCAEQLCRYFIGYDDFNNENIPDQPGTWLAEFESFYQKLDGLTHSQCPGCRRNPASYDGCVAGCVVPACTEKHGVDFCADCAEFPCRKAKDFFDGVNTVIGSDWEKGNFRIREVGIEKYFSEKKEISHYISYKK